MPSNSSTSQNTRIFAPYAILKQDTSRLEIRVKTGQGYSIASGITFGDVVRFNPQYASGGLTGQYTKAQADSDENAEVIGVVENITTDYYTIVTHGSILYPTSRLTGLCGGAGGVDILFLDSKNAGGLTGTVAGVASLPTIVKPVIQIAPHGNYNGIVVNYIGYKLGADVVSPVGYLLGGNDGPGEDLNLPVGSLQYFSENAPLSSNWLDISSSVLIEKTKYPDLFNIYGTTNGQYKEKITTTTTPSILLNGRTAYQTMNGIQVNVGTVIEVNATYNTITIIKNSGISLMNLGTVYFAKVSNSSVVSLSINATSVLEFTVPKIQYPLGLTQGNTTLVPYINTIPIKNTTTVPPDITLNTLVVGGTFSLGDISNLENTINSIQTQLNILNNRFV